MKPPISKGGGGTLPGYCKSDAALNDSGGAPDDLHLEPLGGAAGDEGSGGACGDDEASCAWDAPFVRFEPLAELNTDTDEYASQLFDEERKIYFISRRGARSAPALWTASRSDRFQRFGPPSTIPVLEPLGASGFSLSPDEHTIYLQSHLDMYRASRDTLDAPFGPAERLLWPPGFQEVDATQETESGSFYVSALTDSAAGIFQLTGLGASAKSSLVWRASDAGAGSPTLSRDELTLYFGSSRSFVNECGTRLIGAIWVATRASATEPFANAGLVASLATHHDASPSWLSRDGCRLYFTRPTRNGDENLYVAEKAKPGCDLPR